MNPRTYVSPVSFGLGDLVVSLPAIQALIDDDHRRGRETWLVARSDVQERLAERIDGLDGCISEAGFRSGDGREKIDGAPIRFVDLRDHPIQRDHWWGSAEFEEAFGAIDINEIIRRIGATHGIRADVTGPRPLTAFGRPDVRGTVVLITSSDGPSKQWPASRWRSLARDIGELGVVVRRLCSTPDEVMHDGGLGAFDGAVEGVVAPTPGDAVDVLTSCRAVVGIDTGMTHVAVQQGTPTVMITRAGNVFVRPWANCALLVGTRCDPACAALDTARAHHAQVDLRGFRHIARSCPVGSACLDPVEPAHVLAALQQRW